MSNVTTRTYVTFSQLQPLFTTALAAAGSNMVAVDGATAPDPATALSNATDNNYILFIDDQHYVNYKYRATSTIVLMVAAWILLIVGFTICCFAQCFGGVRRAKQMLCGERFDDRSSTSSDDRTNPNEPVEICRRYPTDFEAESLPSYTIVSGLPTYDDALEEFRKAGIILTPPMPVVKIFEKEASSNGAAAKENQIYNLENGLNSDGDNISLNSTCTCGAASNTPISGGTLLTVPATTAMPQVIELSPEQLAALSQKRLSLQISFNNSIRRNSRPRAMDLYRQVNRNNLLRSRAAAAAAAYDGFPQIHRSSSSSSLSLANEQNMLDQRRLQLLQHRGSLY